MRILIADDHPLFRDGISSLLTAEGHEVVAQVGDGLAALEEAINLRPDLVLMDISMPRSNGIETLRLIKKKAPDVRVVIMTVSEDDSDLLTAFDAGANGYLLKSLNGDEFLSSLKDLENGDLAISKHSASRLVKGIVSQSHKMDQTAMLSSREQDLLALLADGYSNKIIAQRLNLSENTVKYHIKNILQKFNVQNRTEAVLHAIRTGLIKPT
jgi:DNA-binding NarL/FixJ family response regulator